MAVVQCAQQFVEIASNIVVCQGLVELLEVCVVDMFEYQGWGSADRILDYSMQRDDVGSSPQVLQYLDLPLDLLLLHWFQRLHHTLLVVVDVDRLEHLRVFTPSQLPHKLIVILVAPLHHMSLIVPVFPWSVRIHICVHASPTGQRHPSALSWTQDCRWNDQGKLKSALSKMNTTTTTK